MYLDAKHLLCPVTAVHACDLLLLVARGTLLSIHFRHAPIQEPKVHEIFSCGQSIHGVASIPINLEKYVFLVWGGRKARFLLGKIVHHDNPSPIGRDRHERKGSTFGDALGYDYTLTGTSHEFELDDRILHASFKPKTDAFSSGLYAVLVTAHNALWSAEQTIEATNFVR